MNRSPRFLLLQIRNQDDPMREQEVKCFARTLQCELDSIHVHDLLSGAPSRSQIDRSDIALIAGSGEYSATCEDDWLYRVLDFLRDLYAISKPTFGSCWGFQAMARAMGGVVVNDLQRAELGTMPMNLTEPGLQDPIVGPLGRRFLALAGHEDSVVTLPEEATHLAASDRVEFQAFCFPDRPIYATQFHPELDRQGFMDRIEAYPQYIEKIAGLSYSRFVESLTDTPASASILTRFVQYVLG